MDFLRGAVAALCLLASSIVFAAGSVNINKASAGDIADAIKGIGQAKAEAIVAYRAEHGPFKSIDDLVKVKGIGKKTVDSNRDKLIIE